MTRIGIVIGSTRPGRNGEAVGRWVYDLARERDDAEYELVDVAEFNLPHLDEPLPPAMSSDYAHEHTHAWAEKIASFDGFVIVTPEYNHSPSSALKNAIDYLYVEWRDKAVGFVSYGVQGGTRAVEHLRLVFGNLSVATVTPQATFNLADDFEQFSIFQPRPEKAAEVEKVLAETVRWSGALQSLRQPAAA